MTITLNINYHFIKALKITFNIFLWTRMERKKSNYIQLIHDKNIIKKVDMTSDIELYAFILFALDFCTRIENRFYFKALLPICVLLLLLLLLKTNFHSRCRSCIQLCKNKTLHYTHDRAIKWTYIELFESCLLHNHA